MNVNPPISIYLKKIHQSVIYYLFSKEKTIAYKYKEIKLNETKKTLRIVNGITFKTKTKH